MTTRRRPDIELVKRLHRHCGKVGIITDNAGALAGGIVRKWPGDTGGDAELPHLPPHTPQLNPVEVEWREIKAAMAIFGGPDRMRDAIRRMVRNGGMPIVRMFDRLLAA